MSPVSSENVAEALRAVLGGENRYRKFVKQLATPRSDGLLHFWQSAVLDTLEVKHGLVLPRRADELRALLPRYPLPLVSSPLPFQTGSSLNILEVQPQSEPRAGHWRCYFRARHNSWGLGAILGSDVDPVEVSDDSDMTFYAEDEYGEFTDDASYMDLDEARFLIVSELTRLVTSRGLDNISADQ